MSPLAKLLLDLGPLGAFFIANKFGGLMTATIALIVVTALCLTISYIKEKKISPMPLVTGVAVGVFGGLTLYLHDETFIKIKPTLVNLLFATLLIGGVLVKRPPLKYLLSSALSLTPHGWKMLSFRWGLFFIFLAAVNEVVWRNSSTEFWVSFKVFGMMSLTLLFTFTQWPLIKREMVEEAPKSLP